MDPETARPSAADPSGRSGRSVTGSPESVLLFLQADREAVHPGIVDGYRRLQAAGEVSHLDVLPVFGSDGVARGDAFWREAFDRALAHGTTLVVFQYYHSPQLPDPREAIRTLKALPSAPIVASTLGDPYMSGFFGRPNVPRSFLQAAEASDLVLPTSMGAMAGHLRRYTQAPIVLLPHGVCQVRFSGSVMAEPLGEPEFDVVFIGSHHPSRNPLRGQAWLARRRERLVDALSRRFGSRFGLFGKGWGRKSASQGVAPYEEQVAVARRGRVVVGGVPYSRERYYTSDRPFIQMTGAVPMVDAAVEGVDKLMRSGEHWILAPEAELVDAVEAALELDAEERSAIGRAGAQQVFAGHTQAHRVATLVENARRLRRVRETGVAEPPHLPYFLADVDVCREARSATMGWPLAS